MPGHRFDTVGVASLIDGVGFGPLIADKAFDSNTIVANLDHRGAQIVISQHPAGPSRSRSMPRCTNSDISSKTSSANSKSSNALPCAPAKSIRASRQ
ncbi:hypothetical protein [Sphingobium aquiterrae]|uniref:hypothetical protein n=1 Tax=Sphingobium aquiterrae TaxID=2038656 RepID=UPI003019BD1E